MSEILKAFRKKTGLTQKDFAMKIGVSRATIAQVEAGNNSLSADLKHKIKIAFDIDLNNQYPNKSYLNNNSKDNIFNSIDSLLNEGSHHSEINLLQNSNPEILKSEKKIFLINYRQRLSDNLLLLFSICLILRYFNYKFSKKEIEDIKYFDAFQKVVKDIEENDIILTNSLKITLVNLLDSTLFNIIFKYTSKANSFIDNEHISDWDDFLKSK